MNKLFRSTLNLRRYTLDMFRCKYCCAKMLTLDDVPTHKCFLGKDVYMEENNILFTTTTHSSDSYDTNKKQSEDECILPEISPGSSELVNTKQQAVWDKRATLALLAIYEANIENIDHPKKKTKIWSTISMGLLEHGIQVTDQQVRWKMNALMKRYKEVIDNNSKSGRGTIEFEWFQVMDDFLGKKGNVTAAGYTISSKVGLEKVEPSTSQPSVKKFHRYSRKVSEQSAMQNLTTIEESSSNSDNTEEKKALTTHGTGSNIAKTKIELEKQWLKHLQLKEEHDKSKEERNKDLIESKKEALKLKKRHLAMKEKEIEQRHDIAINKMSEKRKRHTDIMEIERLKYKLLRKFIEKKENRNIDVSEESD